MLTVRDYSPAPFWFLNHRLEKEELKRQIGLMKEQNISAFFLHPRAGLLTPYGSREWFELIRFAALEAAKVGMHAWLYDEDPFPSGAAGGRFFFDHPEYRARGLRFFDIASEGGRVRADLGTGTLLEAAAVRTDDRGNVLEKRDLSGDVGVVRSDFFQTLWPSPYYHHLFGKETYNHYRSATAFPHLEVDVALPEGWRVFAVTAETVRKSQYMGIPDNLNAACTKEFIRLTHEKYAEALGDLFGGVIPGIFTDETATGGAFAWTPRFAEEFRGRRGYAIENRWHEIFCGDTDAALALREDYWKTVQELFIDAFFRPVNDWCKVHNLLLCGHGIGEELPVATTNGMNIFALQKYTGIPGFDHITPNIPNWSNFTSLNLGGKVVASAAEQNGEHRVMSECFGCNAYNFNFDGMKRNMRWLYALGVNFLVPHGFHYSYDGFRKDDAGKSFFFQSPDYDRFHEFGAYAGNLGFLLGESRSTAKVCVIYPENEFRRRSPALRGEALELMEKLYELVQFFLEHQVQFEFADEETLERAEILPEGFRCGKKIYSALVRTFPMERPWFERFERFFRTPEACFGMDGFAVLDGEGKPARTVMTQYRAFDGGKRLYFFHNSPQGGTFKLRFDEAPRLLLRYGESMAERFRFEPDRTFRLPAYGCAVFDLCDEDGDFAPYAEPVPPEPDLDFLIHPQWDYIPPVPGIAAAIRDWTVTAGGECREQVRYALLRELFGTEQAHPKMIYERHIFDQAPERKRFYPATAVYRALFTIPDAGTHRWQLLFEHDTFQGKAVLRLNGKTLLSPRRCRVYDPWNEEIDVTGILRSGENRLEAEFPDAGEWDGIASMIYCRECD
ncbi:MAG: hypothetical protein IJS01_15675 [Lentisphaeria bacterium]|nr:hypothetical protein [Lentisphaeria bacterium]